ncbi:MAG: response regulator [Planctomycetaceae bacterium]
MTSAMPSILLVEDDEVDVEAIRRLFARQHIANPLYVASDGVAALRMLHGEDHSEMPQPCVIVLDLNLPRMTGIEFLDELRRDAQLKDSVVFVLTTSNSDYDRVVTHSKYVAGYLLKSDADADYSQLIRSLRPVLRFAEN